MADHFLKTVLEHGIKIIEKLDHKPNVVAKALRSKEKKIKIGIVISPRSNFYGQDVLKGNPLRAERMSGSWCDSGYL